MQNFISSPRLPVSLHSTSNNAPIHPLCVDVVLPLWDPSSSSSTQHVLHFPFYNLFEQWRHQRRCSLSSNVMKTENSLSLCSEYGGHETTSSRSMQNVNRGERERCEHPPSEFFRKIDMKWMEWRTGRQSGVCVCVWMFARARTLVAKANASIFDSKRTRVFIYIRWRGTKCWCWSCCYQQKCTMTLIWFICSQFECKQRTETKSIKLWISKIRKRPSGFVVCKFSCNVQRVTNAEKSIDECVGVWHLFARRSHAENDNLNENVIRCTSSTLWIAVWHDMTIKGVPERDDIDFSIFLQFFNAFHLWRRP